MNRLSKALLRLYPRGWRTRYGEEMEALIADSGGAWRNFSDILYQAVKMRFLSLNWHFAAAFALAGLTLATLLTVRVPPRYASSAEMDFVAADGVNPASLQFGVLDILSNLGGRKLLSAVIQDPRINLYAQQRASLPLEDLIQQMRMHDLQYRIIPTGARHIRVRLSLEGQDSERLQPAVNWLAEWVRSEQARLSQGTLVDRGLGHPVRNPLYGSRFLVNAAPAPAQPTGLSRTAFGFAGCAFGLLAGFLVALIRTRPDVWLLAGSAAFTTGICALAIPVPYQSQARLIADSPQSRQEVLDHAPIVLDSLHRPGTLRLEADRSGVGLSLISESPDPLCARRLAQEGISFLIQDFTERSRRLPPADEPLFGLVQAPTLAPPPAGEIARSALLVAGALLALTSGLVVFSRALFGSRRLSPAA